MARLSVVAKALEVLDGLLAERGKVATEVDLAEYDLEGGGPRPARSAVIFVCCCSSEDEWLDLARELYDRLKRLGVASAEEEVELYCEGVGEWP